MRILMLAQFYAPVIGGEERHVSTLSEALVARGHEVTVAAMSHPSRAATETIRGVSIQSLNGTMQRLGGLFSEVERPHAPPFPDPELTLALGRLVSEFKPDVVHGHNWLLHSFLPLKRRGGPGLVATLHDYNLICAKKTLTRGEASCEGPAIGRCLACAGEHFSPVKGAVTYAASQIMAGIERRAVDHFIAVSTAVAQKSGIVGGAVPYDVIPTLIPDSTGELQPTADPRLDQLPREGYLLFVGDLNRRKGVDVLLDAYARLRDVPPLVLIGRRCTDTPDHLPPNVHLFESWPHHLVMHAWSRCLFGLAPSTWVEPCGTVVMEANAMGKPTIATNHGGLAELVAGGVSGLHVPPNDVDALASAIKLLVTDDDLREKLASGGAERASIFKARSIAPRIEKIYHDVIAARSDRARRVQPIQGTEELAG